MSRKALLAALLCSGFAAVAVAAVSTFALKKEDKWAEVDSFKAGLPAKLAGIQGDPSSFNVVRLADQLGAFRIDGMPVCAHEEIAADQYIRLAEIAESLSANREVSIQLNHLLDGPTSVTDCQFRVLDAATAKIR